MSFINRTCDELGGKVFCALFLRHRAYIVARGKTLPTPKNTKATLPECSVLIRLIPSPTSEGRRRGPQTPPPHPLAPRLYRLESVKEGLCIQCV